MRLSKSLAVLLLAWATTGAKASPVTSDRSIEIPASTAENEPIILDAFRNHRYFDFAGNTIPDGLYANAIGATPDSVTVKNGFLQLTVPGGKATQFKSEVITSEKKILYGSVRTMAVFSETPGVCNGIFFYKSNSQETDIEWLSDPKSVANGGTRRIFLTNQENSGDGKATAFKVDPPRSPTFDLHEYRLDWTKGRVQWFIDGNLLKESTTDVPSEPGAWIWNNWYNGDASWSVGPPAKDAVFKIKSIDMYYNTA